MRVILFWPRRKNPEFKDVDPFKHYRIKPIFSVKKLASYDPAYMVYWPNGIFIKFQIIFYALALFFYLLFLKNKKDAIFYTRDEYLLPLIFLFSRKVVWEAHALPKRSYFYQKYWQKCLSIIVLTRGLKGKLKQFNIKEENILVAPDAVDLSVFDLNWDKKSARRQLGLPLDKIILGYTGSFRTKNMDKGIKDILKALVILRARGREVIFTAVGGDKRDIIYYRPIVKAAGISDLVNLLPRVDQNKLAIYQKAFDVLLMPFPNLEHYRYFMSPMKMFEYMAAQRPIVASDLPTIREILDDSNCVFCRPGDPGDLANKIDQVLSDSGLVDQISTQAYRDVKKYTWVKRAENSLAQCHG